MQRETYQRDTVSTKYGHRGSTNKVTLTQPKRSDEKNRDQTPLMTKISPAHSPHLKQESSLRSVSSRSQSKLTQMDKLKMKVQQIKEQKQRATMEKFSTIKQESEPSSPIRYGEIRKFNVETEEQDIVDKFNVSGLEPRKSLSQPKNLEMKISFHDASGLGVTKVTTDNEESKNHGKKDSSEKKN